MLKYRILSVAVPLALVGAIGIAIYLQGFFPKDEGQPAAQSIVVNEIGSDTDGADNDDGQNSYDIEQLESANRQISFPSGRKIDVVFRSAPRLVRGDDIPENIASQFNELSLKVDDGDALAALVLHRSLEMCGESPLSSRSELDAAIERIRRTGTVTINDGTADIEVSASGDTPKHMQRQFDLCKGIDDDQIASSSTWLRRAADLGDPNAMKSLVMRDLGNSAEGRAYLLSAFDAGFYDTIGTLGLYLSWGGRSPYKPSGDENPYESYDNKVVGYAYYYLYMKLYEADGKFSQRAMDKQRSYFEADIKPYVNPDEEAQAFALAETILDNNPNCCMTLRN